jgi:hypothetical protein
MRVRAFTQRGTGTEFVEGSGPVIGRHGAEGSGEDGEHIVGGYMQILSENEITLWLEHGDDRARVFATVDEIRTIVEFLRSNGIEVDRARERQRKLAEDLAGSFGPELPAEPHITVTWRHRSRNAPGGDG